MLSMLSHDSDLPARLELLGKKFVMVRQESRQLGSERGPLAAYNGVTNRLMIFQKEISERVQLGQMSSAEGEAYATSVTVGHEVNGHYVLAESEVASRDDNRVYTPIGCLALSKVGHSKVGLNPDRISYRLSQEGPNDLTDNLITHELFAYNAFSDYVDKLGIESVSINAKADLDSMKHESDEHSVAAILRNGPYGQAARDLCKDNLLEWTRVVTFDNEGWGHHDKIVGLGPRDATTIRALNELKVAGSLDLLEFVDREQSASISRQQKAISEKVSRYGLDSMTEEKLGRLIREYRGAEILSEKEVRGHVDNALSLFQDEVISLSHSKTLADAIPLLFDRLSLVVVDELGKARLGQYFLSKTLSKHQESVDLACELIALDGIIQSAVHQITEDAFIEFRPIIDAAKRGDPLPQPVIGLPDPWMIQEIVEDVEYRATPTLRRINRLISGETTQE